MWREPPQKKSIEITRLETAKYRGLSRHNGSYRVPYIRHFALIIFSLVLSVPSFSSSEIPKVFQGTWDVNDKACKAEHSDMRLRIGPSAVEYWESKAELIEVIEAKNISLRARFSFSGEGEIWENIMTYFLLNEGSKLVQASDDESQMSRIRCTDIHHVIQESTKPLADSDYRNQQDNRQ